MTFDRYCVSKAVKLDGFCQTLKVLSKIVILIFWFSCYMTHPNVQWPFCDLYFYIYFSHNFFLMVITTSVFVVAWPYYIKGMGNIIYLFIWASFSLEKNFFSENVTYISKTFSWSFLVKLYITNMRWQPFNIGYDVKHMIYNVRN